VIFQILILLLVVGLAMFLANEGLYSAVIMALCAIFSAAIAFNFYEPVAGLLTGSIPEHAHAAALAGLFLVPMIVLRILADKLLPGMVHFPYWADRAFGPSPGRSPG